MMSGVLCTALMAMAPNRSEESWLAGSSVIAHLLKRIPNDIDIHHLLQGAFERAIEQDTNVLTQLGFVATESKVSPSELERTFVHGQGTVKINWVLEPERPTPLISDPSIGLRQLCGNRGTQNRDVQTRSSRQTPRGSSLPSPQRIFHEDRTRHRMLQSQLAGLELRPPT
ncbi:hypothetical protein AB3480_34740 [Rhizobium mongolense]|uniref:hypothetical protein n=1 Tax=Rhizobium mongolense TaxID=57676 RepID=UPI0034A55DDE